MPNFRRSQYLLFTLEDFETKLNSAGHSSWVVTSPLSGQHFLVSSEELVLFRTLSCEEWISEEELRVRGFEPLRLEKLIQLGMILSDERGCPWEAFREREERLIASHWPPCAATFHLLSQHQESLNSPLGRVLDTFLGEQEAEARAARFLEVFGPPPEVFYQHPESLRLDELPLEPLDNEVAAVMIRRRTCRHFEPKKSLGFSCFSKLLRLVFGPVAIRTLAGSIRLLLKTSPSGGSLHPIEAFPLIFRCDGLEPGLYHYRCDVHGLAALREIPEAAARQLAIYLAQGQSFVGTCSALIILVARFERNFWKYQERENSYSVVLQDAGHLSQSFQIAAGSIGLASFYTAAINSEAITDLMGLKYPAEAPIGLLGVGVGQPEEPGEDVLLFDPRGC